MHVHFDASFFVNFLFIHLFHTRAPCAYCILQAQYPGIPADNPLNAYYTEMLEIGYRYYNSHNIQPKFAFGHGLSYTTFSYSDLQVNGRVVTFMLSNTGSRTGYEVNMLI